MSEPIKPALTAEGWAEALNDYGGDISVPPYPPDEKEEFYNSPRRLAAICLYGQPFGFTREDVADCGLAASQYELSAKRYRNERDGGITAEAHEKLATRFRERAARIEALLPPEKEGA